VARSASSQLALKHIAELLIKHGARSGDENLSPPDSRASAAHDDVRIPPEDRGTQDGHSSCLGKRITAHMNVGLWGPSSFDFVSGLLVLWAVSISYIFTLYLDYYTSLTGGIAISFVASE
jgi:hypothetical protein